MKSKKTLIWLVVVLLIGGLVAYFALAGSTEDLQGRFDRKARPSKKTIIEVQVDDFRPGDMVDELKTSQGGLDLKKKSDDIINSINLGSIDELKTSQGVDDLINALKTGDSGVIDALKNADDTFLDSLDSLGNAELDSLLNEMNIGGGGYDIKSRFDTPQIKSRLF